MTLSYPDLDTPALIVDLDVLERNIGEMVDLARRVGVKLRPHTKTHKSPRIAALQIAAGADGITCAKLGEAEVMADAGIDDILVAYPLWGDDKIQRLRDLRARARVRVSLDSVEVAEAVGGAAGGAPGDVEVLVEVDTGHGRCGRPPGRPTADLVRDVAAVAGVEVIGLLTHPGHAYRATGPEELQAIAHQEVTGLVETAEVCRNEGIDLREISVGSTPTVRRAAQIPGVTEIRPGAYIFNDAKMIQLGVARPETVAAKVLVTVVSRPARDRFVVDAGTKTFTSDWMGAFEDWIVADGRPDLHMEFLTEEHGVGRCGGEQKLRIGDRLAMIPGHICTTVNMFDVAYGVRGGEVVEEIPIAARGRVR